MIVGAGSSGCVMAERLSANGRHTACCCSKPAGATPTYNIHVPLMVANVLNDTRWTWPYMTEPQTHLNGQPQKWARGRVIGGSSSINGNLFVRGDPKEYDNWRDQGCRGWGYSDLLPIFKRLEDFPGRRPGGARPRRPHPLHQPRRNSIRCRMRFWTPAAKPATASSRITTTAATKARSTCSTRRATVCATARRRAI